MTAALKLVHNSHPREGKKDYINHLRLTEPKTGVFFTDFIEMTVARRMKRMSKSYGRNYKTLLLHITNFQNQFDVVLYTNSINEEFLDDFIIYLEELNLSANYIKMLVELATAMASAAFDKNYATDPSFRDVEVKSDPPEKIYLSMNQVSRIYYFIGLTKKQERVRDLFVVGCLTGLRYSDYSRLSKHDFQGDYIIKVTQKTGAKVYIPIHDYVRDIYSKYEGEIPAGMSVQNFNRQLKKICHKMAFNDPVISHEKRGGRHVTSARPLWECVTSHR